MFAATGCPESYFISRIPYICDKVNAMLSGTIDTVSPPRTEYKVYTDLKGYISAADAVYAINARVIVAAGTYYIFNQTSEAINVTKKAGTPGAWINKSLNVPPVSPPTVNLPSQTKTLEQIAREVIGGQWGNGDSRIESLTAAGFIASNVQQAVNAIIVGNPIPDLSLYLANTNSPPSSVKSLELLAREVIDGLWGNDPIRTQRLTAAGYIAANIQAAVNALLKNLPVPKLPVSAALVPASQRKSNEAIAREVLNGLWGNGAERKNRLTAAGYNYNDIQEIVNKLL